MKAITTKGTQFHRQIKVSTGLIKQILKAIGRFFDFDEIRKIERRKQQELHEAGLDKIIFK